MKPEEALAIKILEAFLKYVFPTLFLLAQVLLIQMNQKKAKKQNGQFRYNPHAPGEAQACKDHKAALAKLGEKMEDQGKAIARVEEGQDAQEKRLDWIQGKLNGK